MSILSRKEGASIFPGFLAATACLGIFTAIYFSRGPDQNTVVAGFASEVNAAANVSAGDPRLLPVEISYPAVSDPQSLGKHLAFRASQELAAGGTSNYDPNDPKGCEHRIEALLNALRVLTYDADPTNLIQKGVIKILVNRQDPSVFKIFIPDTGVSVHVSQGGIQTAYFKAGSAIETPTYRNFTSEDFPLLKDAWSAARKIFNGRSFLDVTQEVLKAFNDRLAQLGITVGCKSQ